MKNLSLYLLLTSVIFIFFTLSCGESGKSTETNNNSYSQHQDSYVEEVKKPKCHHCDGTGIYTCKMCNATGINNMGIECGCVRNYKMLTAMGDSNPGTPLKWECDYCNGTGFRK